MAAWFAASVLSRARMSAPAAATARPPRRRRAPSNAARAGLPSDLRCCSGRGLILLGLVTSFATVVTDVGVRVRNPLRGGQFGGEAFLPGILAHGRACVVHRAADRVLGGTQIDIHQPV